MRTMAVFALLLAAGRVRAQESPQLDAATRQKLREIVVDLAAAQAAEDEAGVSRSVKRAIELLGEQAGIPEVADELRTVPENARPLEPRELATAFVPYIDYIQRKRWWDVGLDPTKTNHALREVAAVIEGCLAARSAGANQADELLSIAQDAGNFLVWAQEDAGTGVFPFPAVRNGSGRPFEVAERFYRHAEQEGTLDHVIINGWSVEDLNDGGLQFDNGLSGAALVRLFEATGDERYKQSALHAADWAINCRVVTNWNYNSFSVLLLSDVYRVTGDRKYLEAAKRKTRLGVLPGQLSTGPRRGRWFDPHNARPAYHYIMVRGLAALAAVLPPDDADLPPLIECLRFALSARNPDFEKGIINADSTVEALVRVKAVPPYVAEGLTGCQTDEALATLERYAAAGFRAKKMPLGPGAWGQLLKYSTEQQ